MGEWFSIVEEYEAQCLLYERQWGLPFRSDSVIAECENADDVASLASIADMEVVAPLPRQVPIPKISVAYKMLFSKDSHSTPSKRFSSPSFHHTMAPRLSVLICILHLLFHGTSSDSNHEETTTEQCNVETSHPVEYVSDELPIVVLDYEDLRSKRDLSLSIESGFGREGLGILFVKNVPELSVKRLRLLRLARELAYLDDEVKMKLQDEDSLYSIGYSHGKEMLAKDKPDIRKLSYYGNPITDDVTNGNEELIASHRATYGRNVWPDNDLPTLQESFMDLGTLIHSVGQLIAHQLDEYVMTQRDGYRPGLFKGVIGTNIPKARLLYYFSDQEMEEMFNVTTSNEREDGWCGWHNDHSALTGLILGQFYDGNGGIISDIADQSEETSKGKGGLYIRTRQNVTHHVELDEETSSKYLAFQIGETSQILSGGVLAATPHAVMGYRGSEYRDISRSSFAVFHQPHYYLAMTAPFHDGVDLETVQYDGRWGLSIPKLSSRWWNGTGDTFGAFTTRTFETYYNMKMK